MKRFVHREVALDLDQVQGGLSRAAYECYFDQAAGAVAGAATLGGIGAGAGSFVAPGIGTAIGGLGGAVIGGFSGWALGEGLSAACEQIRIEREQEIFGPAVSPLPMDDVPQS